MTSINSNISGIAEDPNRRQITGGFNDPIVQASNVFAGTPGTEGIAEVSADPNRTKITEGFRDTSPTSSKAEPMDLNKELATIRAIQASTPGANDGIAASLGTAGGGIVGAVFGGGAVGATVGAAAGGSIGAIVDNMISKGARDRAEKKRIAARRQELARQEMIQKDAINRQAKQDQHNLSAGIGVERKNNADMRKLERESALAKLLNGINNKSIKDQTLKNKFLAGVL